ncbi:uncharacterized protein EMH_0066080 [Eimeria mitis]|uniref:Uncharacterized protein n=1 Tax=Eimeria mitis TaxID=44415 RepID=U6KL13_9EIME|nr:uncharacterized protein EMH_0066080 [Eimeria mitis]CDJ36148.1 hypothetical protein EMH_0066080 [Eimeria mitis]
MTWKELKQQNALHTSLSDRAQNWLFCGVPKEHVSSFRSLLKSSNIGDAVVVEAGCIEPDSPLPSLPSGRIESVVFVGGLWRTSSSTACLDELRAVLLAYSRSAQSDPEFRPPFCAIVNCSNSSFGIPTQHNPNKHGADFDIRQAGLLGMCRTSRLEVQRLCKRPFQMLYVNVEDDSAGCLSKAWSWIDTQCGLLNTSSALVEEDVVITSDCHMVPRLEQVSTSQSANRIAVTSKKSYVVTGGTGGLGLSVAEWLLKNGAGMVALLSRSGKPANTLLDMPAWKTVEEGMNAHRAAIMLCDVADAQRLMDTLSKIHKSIPIGGIFHCAGYEGDASIVDTSLRSIERVYEPKAHGAWNLHLACQELDLDRDLDMFVLFSSISTLPGNDALATYAAANAYLDSLSYWRRSQGLKAQSIQWGPWNDVGMVTRNEKLDRVFKSRGIKPFMPEEGIKVMEMALETEEPCVCALNVNWKKYSQAFGHNAPLALAEIQSEEQIQPKSTRAEGPSKESIAAIVIEAAESLVDTDSRISPDTRLDELGLDSLGSVELRNLLQDRLAMSLPASLLVEFATLGEVIEYIAEDLCGGQAWGSTTRTPDPKPHLSGASEEGFAVIGMGCRLPGKSNSPEEFWNMLLAETDCVEDIPWQRFNIQPLFDPDPEENKCYVKEAALLENAHLFDNEFFQMTESQARNIDPQQRVLLEVAYETFVDAQYKREEVKGQEIGVFCATYTNDYHLSSLTKGENGILAIGEGVDGGVPRLGEASGYPEPGSLMCLIPNRISYSFGLIGPSIGVDTACASGLVALDTAVMKLRLSACTKAFVGAVSLILVPCFFLGGSKTRQFAKSGRCRTFDAAADGLVRGEGAAGILLAPLSAARSESKFVHAIVRGTAISHYGRGARLTAPNTRALARVMNLALNDGGVDQKMVRCYEAHGTATVLGDIIEMNALKQVFEDRPKETPLIVGTAHNNIGHLDSAAALVAFIKTVLSLKHRYVPPNIQFNKMHPDITAFDTSRIVYVREGQAIRTADNQTKIFGANLAYGLGGTVVAAITEEGDDPAKAPQVTRHVWKHNSFPLDSQKFVFLLGAAALLAQDRKQTPRDDVACLVGCICKNMLTRQNLASLSPCIPPDLVSEIFLTGATGLTGSQILLSLLEQQIDCGRDGQKRFPRIYCLVQARDRMHAMYRIVDAVIGRGGQWKQRYFEQVVPVVGDLRAPRLGLSQKTFDALTSTVEAVYHAGRVVDFALPYEAIRKANVLSLLPLVEMCTTGKAKHLHVLSDFAAHIQYFAAFAGDLNQPISEELSVSQPLMDRMENQMPASIMGYPWARWAVEEVLAKCQDWIDKLHASAADDLQDAKTKFNFTIYRLPNSAVYFNNGRVEFLNPFFAITMTALQQGVVPPGVLPVGPPFLTTPIDISADILVRISRRLHRPTVIHIVNPVGVRREALNQTLLALKIPFRESCEDEFLRGIEKNQNSSAAYTLLPVMRFWRLYWFSEDLDRKDAFPIVTANIEACLPNALKQFPHPSEVWTRMLAYW